MAVGELHILLLHHLDPPSPKWFYIYNNIEFYGHPILWSSHVINLKKLAILSLAIKSLWLMTAEET